LQVCHHLKKVSEFTDIRVIGVIGSMAEAKQQRLLRACPEVVVATPGRLWELMAVGEPYLLKVHVSADSLFGS
jgi:ATP-dependent RNA helicase DDX24/MAK5